MVSATGADRVRNKRNWPRVVGFMTTLFDSLELGRLTLPNRVTMAALTRSRAGRDGVPTPLHETYYSQRASMGLIVTEGVFPAVTSRAFPASPVLKLRSRFPAGGAWPMPYTKPADAFSCR